jgi:glutamine synthetase
MKGILTLDQLKQKASAGQIDTVITAFPDQYGRLMGKRCTAEFFIDTIAAGGMHACDYILTVDMEMDVVPGYKLASWEKGYGDFHCVPDFSTMRELTWLDRTALVLCDLENDKKHEAVAPAPRTIVKRQIERLKQAGFAAMGASELEYFIFDETYESAAQKGYDNLKTFGSYIEDYHIFQGTKSERLNAEIRRHMDASGIPVESSKGEWGPGQQELNLRYTDILSMCDRHVIYKQGVKEIAMQQNLAVTFMAKWKSEFAGSSAHMHLSLWDKDFKDNVFRGSEKFGPVECSNEFRWFLGGWMKHVRAITPFYAPYPTSYKRFLSQSWAPTSIAWSHDNRTAGFRVVGSGKSLRIEARFPGADANPYLAFAASLAAGLDGIQNRIEPEAIFEGDVYSARSLPKVPSNLMEGVAALEHSSMLKEAFGADVVEHYAHFFKVEQQKFDSVVTSWERARYFERA